MSKIVDQVKQVTDLVKASSAELLCASGALAREIANPDGPCEVTEALAKNRAARARLEAVVDLLAVVGAAVDVEIRNGVMLGHQFAAATEQEQAARHASFHDVLTGLPNRALFYDRLEQGIAQAERHQRALAVMFLDIDQFKSINDSHGHDVGDRVLKTVARRLRKSVRSADTISRIGGDEFVLVLMEIGDKSSVAMTARKIIKAIQTPMSIRTRKLNIVVGIDASIGISVSSKDGNTARKLLVSADAAMYEAKRSKSGYSFSQ